MACMLTVYHYQSVHNYSYDTRTMYKIYSVVDYTLNGLDELDWTAECA